MKLEGVATKNFTRLLSQGFLDGECGSGGWDPSAVVFVFTEKKEKITESKSKPPEITWSVGGSDPEGWVAVGGGRT